MQNNWIKVGLLGAGDLADIAKLVANGTSLNLQVIAMDTDFAQLDAVIITDIMNPQYTYDVVKTKMSVERILTLKLLHISKDMLENVNLSKAL